jgi:hypothetical protein
MRSQKRCPRCGVTQPGEAFGWDRKGRLRAYCRPCFRKAWREWYYRNPRRHEYLAQIAARNKRHRERNARIVREAKSVPCADCGKRFPPYVMDFDHLGDKVANVSYLMPSAGEERLQSEMAKCEVVCSNCHRVRTHERQIARRAADAEVSITASQQRPLPGLG